MRAAAAGTVVFAGSVGNGRHVVVRHAGGLRTSYSFLASVTVHRAEAVAEGEILGTTGGHGDHHPGRELHLGLRIGDTFVDPMQLFGRPDLSAVHLTVGGPSGQRSGRRRPPPRRVTLSLEIRSLVKGLAGPGQPLVLPTSPAGFVAARPGRPPPGVAVCDRSYAVGRPG